MTDPATRLARLETSLEGLSVGDALGERFFVPPAVFAELVAARATPRGPWPYTDDTEMALAIAEVLSARGTVDRSALAAAFARRYAKNPRRGYGAAAHDILAALVRGEPWAEVARRPYDGQGSMGNGGAMRVAPLGAYFADDDDRVVLEARASAEVTHAHPEGQAGAIAVALAAAFVAREDRPNRPAALFAHVLARTPAGLTKDGLARAADLDPGTPIERAVERLGNGSRVIAPDTVPLALWLAAHHLGDFEDAMFRTIEARGDIDTNCAIVGGIVALALGAHAIPEEWRRAREPLER